MLPLGASQRLQVLRGLLLNIATGRLLHLSESFHQRRVGMRNRVGSGVIAGGQDHTASLLLRGLLQRHLCSIHSIALGHGLQAGTRNKVSVFIYHQLSYC